MIGAYYSLLLLLAEPPVDPPAVTPPDRPFTHPPEPDPAWGPERFGTAYRWRQGNAQRWLNLFAGKGPAPGTGGIK